MVQTTVLLEVVPNPISLRNNKSAEVYRDFVDEALAELITTERVIQLSQPPRVIYPLSVSVQSNDKKRLILDLYDILIIVCTKRR